MDKKSAGFYKLKAVAEQAVNKYFVAIKLYTKFCAKCGKPYDMITSKHTHLPFCEECRKSIINSVFGTVEKIHQEAFEKRTRLGVKDDIK